MNHTSGTLQATLSALLDKAKKSGACHADLLYTRDVSSSISCRMGALEGLDRAEHHELGIRVMKDGRQAIVATCDLQSATLDALLAQAIETVDFIPADPYIDLPPKSDIAPHDLDTYDALELTADAMKALALEVEEAALSVPGITNSLGAGYTWAKSQSLLMNTNGFVGHEQLSYFAGHVTTIAEAHGDMQRDYASYVSVHYNDLPDPASIGREAATRTLKRLSPKKPPTKTMPIVFDPRVGKSLLGHFADYLSGASVARGTSLLKDRMGQKVCNTSISIIDNPWLKRGLASRFFDGEGVVSKPLTLVENGILQDWLLNTRIANQLGLASNGRASRAASGTPGVGTTNLMVGSGVLSPKELMSDIEEGIYITDLMGFGFNPSDGAFSQGAFGFSIENGQITTALHEFTIAGNLLDMFTHMTPANDLVFDHATNTPTLRVESMIVAGQ